MEALLTDEDWTESFRRDLVRAGLLTRTRGTYRLTRKGEHRVLMELGKYSDSPAMLYLIEQWFVERLMG